MNQRGLRTRAGAKFQCRTIKNILQNRAYLGYIIKRDVASPHIPILQIIDETTFEKANQILAKRSVATVQRRSIPRKGKQRYFPAFSFAASVAIVFPPAARQKTPGETKLSMSVLSAGKHRLLSAGNPPIQPKP